MSLSALYGQYATLTVTRFLSQGAYLALPNAQEPETDEVLLPSSEVPQNLQTGDELEVFIYLDSEDRPTGTLLTPKLTKGEVGFLKVKDITSFGAFFDWGLIKDLYVPLAEQTQDLRIGKSYPVYVYIDNTGRLAGTMKVSEYLSDTGPFKLDEWVSGECWRIHPDFGMFAILEKQYVGLLPSHEYNPLKIGEKANFRIAFIHEDGKMLISLRKLAYQEIDTDAALILSALKAPNAQKIGDPLSPERIKNLFGISKKAFKRAVGNLLKQSLVTTNSEGYLELLSTDSKK